MYDDCQQMTNSECGSPGPVTITNKLQREKDQLEARLAKVNQAINLIQAEPKIKQILDALAELSLRL